MEQYNLIVIHYFRSVIHPIHYKQMVVECFLPDIYFAPSNMGGSATQNIANNNNIWDYGIQSCIFMPFFLSCWVGVTSVFHMVPTLTIAA